MGIQVNIYFISIIRSDIEENIEKGINIIFDRYAYSGVAYTSAKV